ncbi:MAG TPA: helix-turn-helix domain-containing protein [Microvirga sp.]|nr:helix-turn-helix domain-containing protein [Microvirga sp.]
MVEDHPFPSAAGRRSAHAAAKSEFAERLRAAMEAKGWTVADTARQVARLLGGDTKFSSSHISHYLSGTTLPRFRYLQALSRALDVRPEDLLPWGVPPQPDEPSEGDRGRAPFQANPDPAQETASSDLVHVRDYGDGTALLQVLQRVPWTTALEVLSLVKGEAKTEE